MALKMVSGFLAVGDGVSEGVFWKSLVFLAVRCWCSFLSSAIRSRPRVAARTCSTRETPRATVGMGRVRWGSAVVVEEGSSLGAQRRFDAGSVEEALLLWGVGVSRWL